jgi:hypothetical protein
MQATAKSAAKARFMMTFLVLPSLPMLATNHPNRKRLYRCCLDSPGLAAIAIRCGKLHKDARRD